VWNEVLGLSLEWLVGGGALYAALLLVDVVGVMVLIRIRRRRAKFAAAHAWTEPLDLATLRLRMRIVEPDAQAAHLPQTRDLLDELHRRESRDKSTGISGVAGSSRRR
jgi:hypothetical protein